MHGGQVISIFIFFSKYPFGGISYTLPLLGFQFRFFCLFTQTQPHKNQSDPNKIFVFLIFQYTLLHTSLSLRSRPHQKSSLFRSRYDLSYWMTTLIRIMMVALFFRELILQKLYLVRAGGFR